jgi:hypothetical protein
MKLSTMYLALCFALAPVAARAMVQHRDTLHELRRHAVTATAIVWRVKLEDM